MSTVQSGDGLDLYLHDWTIDSPKAAVALLHGYGEHAGRYAHVAEVFNARGISVTAVDLRGHGRSPGTRGHVDRFNDYYLDATAALDTARAAAGTAPLFVLGHSMGGLLALDWLTSGVDRNIAGLVLSSPFLGVALEVGAVKEALGKVMSNIYGKLALPSGLKGGDVTRDADNAQLYDSDPLNNKNATARWYTEAMSAIDRVFGRVGDLQVPLLLLYGGEDKVASADAIDRLVPKLTMSDRTTERLAGYYHELVNEPPAFRDPVMTRMADWILEHA